MTKVMYVPLSDEEMFAAIRCDMSSTIPWSETRTCKPVEIPKEVIETVEREAYLLDESSDVRLILEQWLSQFHEEETTNENITQS